ncbi:hypothetical protein, partial [Mesorhizobium sp. M7A.F.Ca.CA.002.09.1.1]|uniref:hypothetical protein n=1 Tax=Mesorhizobium sp. M7A.F.Ca.CA.002.09.1.1 TaxID=2496739 RepID=UPI0019D30463
VRNLPAITFFGNRLLMVDAGNPGAQSPEVNEAGRLSMASPPKGGLRDAAGICDLCFELTTIATDRGAEL